MSCCCGGAGAWGGGRAEWQRIYDRVEALAAGRAQLEARNRIQHEFWDARDKINQSRLHQAELRRSRWEAACRELLSGDDPKLAELLESDLEDSRTCEALLDTENSELLVQLKEVGTCVELNENTADHEHTDLISELRKLKRTYETLCLNKDKEATEAAQKLQQKIEELQVAVRKKDDEIGRLQAETSSSTNKILVLEGKLNEMHSLDKENGIQSLKVGQPETHKHKLAFLSTIQSKEAGNSVEIIQENADHGAIAGDLRAELRKLKQAYETLSSNKDKEISAPLAVEDFLLNKLLGMGKDNAGLLKIKEVEAAQANEAAQKLQQTVEELQVAVRYKDDKIGRLRAEAGPLKIKEVEAAQANKAVQMLQQNVEELQVAVRNKDDEIGKLGAEVGHLKIKQVEAAQKLQQNVEELQVAVRNKDNEIGRLQAEAGILNIKEVEAVQKLQQNVDVLQVEVRNKDDENCRLRAEAAKAEKMVLTLEGKLLEMQSLVKEKNDEIQKLKNGQPESLKCKCASSIPVEALTAAESNFAVQQAARAEADNKWRVAVTELEKTRAELDAYKKTAETEKAALTNRANDAEGRLKVVSDELQSLKQHIFKMTSAIFGERSRQLSSDSVIKLKAVYALAEQLYCGTLCTMKAMLTEKCIPKHMKGVIELLSTLPK